MSYLSICSVFRDEAPYLAEFLEFHLLQGVEHFYLYNHRSKDDYWKVLEPYVEQGLVTLTHFFVDPPQFAAYNDALKSYKYDTKWMAFIDVDEFLFSTHDLLPVSLKDYEGLLNGSQIGALAVRWLIFGSNGHETKTEGLVIERFTKRPAVTDKHVKSIVQPIYTREVGKNPHVFRLKQGCIAVDESYHILPKDYAITAPGPADKIVIAHFHTKSREEYFARKKNPDSGSGRENTNLEERFRVHDINEVEDLRWAEQSSLVKNNLALRNYVRIS